MRRYWARTGWGFLIAAISASVLFVDMPSGHAQRPLRPPRPGRALQRPLPPSGSPDTWMVGPDEEFKKPSEVARRVRSGDTVKIAPGTYEDCTTWPRTVDGLVIEGTDVIIEGPVCAGKALFVIAADNVTIRGITFRNAKDRAHNGAGIRQEGLNLTIENSRFIDNEDGILGIQRPRSTMIIRDSLFQGNGTCTAACAHGIYVNKLALLHIEHSQFLGQHEGHHVKSRALRTELVDNIISDGPDGNSSYLIDIPNGGDVVITGNKLEKGAHATNRTAAIIMGEEAVGRPERQNPATEVRIEDNSFVNQMTARTIFVRNKTETPAVLRGNKIEGPTDPLDGPGSNN